MQDFYLLKSEFTETELECLDSEYQRLYEKSKAILKNVETQKISLSTFYQTHNEALIVVPEISDASIPCRFEHIAQCSEKMNGVVIKKIEKRIQDLMGEPFVLFKDKCNVKNPGGGAFPPHQDFAAYYHFGPQFHMTAAVILDDSTIENGCLEVAVNYKKVMSENTKWIINKFGHFPLFDFYRGGKNNGDIKEEISRQLVWTPIETKKGDVLLFDSFLPHRSQKNHSQRHRRNFFFTFNALSEGHWYQKYYDLKRKQFDNPIFHIATPTKHKGVMNEV